MTMGCIHAEKENHNFGLVLMPTFCYKKGTLHTCDANAHTLLANTNISTDAMAFGMHEDKPGLRDERHSVLSMVLAVPKDRHLSE